jgi:hypothetical protein
MTDPRISLSHRPGLMVAVISVLAMAAACSRRGSTAETPREAFEVMRAAAMDRDFKTVFDRCDEKGQSLLLEVAYGLFTMELWERYHFGPKDTSAIQQAFTKELGLDPDALEASERDSALRRKTLLLMIETSKGPMRDAFGEMLRDFARLQFSSVEMLDENTARITLTADNAPRSGYMTRQDGRWLLVSGLSFPGGDRPAPE